MGKAKHSARDGWIYIDGETFSGMRADIGGDPTNSELKIAWKYLYTAKDTWLGPKQDLGAIGATYNLTMDPYEKYDMTFNPLEEFDKSIVDYPNIKRFPGGASNDLSSNLQDPANPLPLMDIHKVVQIIGNAD
jgi:hypothetical protein